jgi:threonine 3-dehydrogenase
MYMPDGVRALLELAMADRARLTRAIYNIAAFSPRADEIATSVKTEIPDAKFSFNPDPARQGILDSWPKSLDDSAARRDWGWKPRYDLDAMTRDLIPKIRRMLELGAILSSH